MILIKSYLEKIKGFEKRKNQRHFIDRSFFNKQLERQFTYVS